MTVSPKHINTIPCCDTKKPPRYRRRDGHHRKQTINN
jgi:hypothetical protein